MITAFWAVDVEGNGASPPEIIEFAMLKIENLKITDIARRSLVKPKEPITEAVTRIHGITNEDVAGSPTLEDISDDIRLWLDDVFIVGHNVRVELDALNRSIPDWKPRGAIDTIQIAKILLPGLPSYGLEKLGEAMGLSNEAKRLTGGQHHSAAYDATLSALIFIQLLDPLSTEKRQEVLQDADILNPKQGALW